MLSSKLLKSKIKDTSLIVKCRSGHITIIKCLILFIFTSMTLLMKYQSMLSTLTTSITKSETLISKKTSQVSHSDIKFQFGIGKLEMYFIIMVLLSNQLCSKRTLLDLISFKLLMIYLVKSKEYLMPYLHIQNNHLFKMLLLKLKLTIYLNQYIAIIGVLKE